MIKNNIKMAWRSLKRQPFFSFLNIVGLAIGISGGLLISLFIYDELSFDKMFLDSDRIHRVNVDIKFGGVTSESAVVTAPMAPTLKEIYPQIEITTRFKNLGSILVKEVNAQQNVKELHTTYVDSTFFEMFGLRLLEGDINSALKEPNTLVMTKTAAKKHFGDAPALGKSVLLNNHEKYTITGVMEDFPKNSFLRNHSLFLSMSGYKDAQEADWGDNNYYTLIKLFPGAKTQDLEKAMNSVTETYLLPWAQKYYPGMTMKSFLDSGNHIHFNTIPLTDIHLYSNRNKELSINGDIQNIYILSIIGLFLVFLASVNFMNLSTAYSLKRSKEVGIRKTLGSYRKGLVKQFLTESVLVSFVSLLFSLVLTILVLPLFNELAQKEIEFPLYSFNFWLIFLVSTFVLGLISGSYPAFFISRFNPIQALKGKIKTGEGSVRNTLVVVQFAISIFLIVGTLVIYQQLKYIQNKDLGYTKNQVLIIDDLQVLGGKADAFKQEVEHINTIKSTTLSNYLPTSSMRNNSTYFIEGVQDQDNAIDLQKWDVDYDYIPTMDMKIIAGRNFDRQFKADSTAIIVNESALSILQVQPEEAIGMVLIPDRGGIAMQIIGVSKNFHYESLRKDVEPLALTLGGNKNTLAVKLNTSELANTIAQIEALWKNMYPGQSFNHYFMDDSYNMSYDAEQRLGKIFMVFTILSLLIACLGLFGLAAFNAEKRTKEIGVRKVLGASVGQITYRLAVDFLTLVAIAALVALPIGWYIMDKWLEGFSYRVAIPWWIFGLAAFLAVAISLLTVSYQSIKAAIANPVKSLRTE